MMIGIIGTQWGLFLGQELRSFYTGHITVCGRDPQRTRKVSGLLMAGTDTLDWRKVRDADYLTHVILAVPPELHLEIAGELLHAGKHVFVEKPLSWRSVDGRTLIEIAKANEYTLAVGENIPFRPSIIEAKKRVVSTIGEPRLFVANAIHRQTFKNPGILLDFAVHYIRAVRALFGEPDTVFACQAQTMPTQNSSDNVILVLSSSSWRAVITLSWQASVGRVPEIILTGTNGAMKIWPDNTLEIYPNEPNRMTRMISRMHPNSLRQMFESPETQRQRVRLPKEDKMGYRAELQNFLAMTPGDVSSAIEAWKDLLIVDAAYQSLKSGKPESATYSWDLPRFECR